jgi:hypothetical protein
MLCLRKGACKLRPGLGALTERERSGHDQAATGGSSRLTSWPQDDGRSYSAVAYAGTLGKPITRLYITHYHPDHLLCAPAFPSAIYALASVAAKIDAVGDRVAAEEHEKRLTLDQLAELAAGG